MYRVPYEILLQISKFVTKTLDNFIVIVYNSNNGTTKAKFLLNSARTYRERLLLS